MAELVDYLERKFEQLGRDYMRAIERTKQAREELSACRERQEFFRRSLDECQAALEAAREVLV